MPVSRRRILVPVLASLALIAGSAVAAVPVAAAQVPVVSAISPGSGAAGTAVAVAADRFTYVSAVRAPVYGPLRDIAPASAHVGSLHDVSCGRDTTCIVVTSKGYVIRGTGLFGSTAPDWHPPRHVSTHGGLVTVSCPTTSFCVAGSHDGDVYVLGHSSVHRTELGSAVEDVSCSSPVFCVALRDGPGRSIAYSVWNGKSWKGGGTVPGSGSDYYQLDVSCPGAGTCWVAAQNSRRDTVVLSALRAGTWSVTRFAEGYSFDAAVIDCADATHCTLSEGDGHFRFLADGIWSPVNVFRGDEFFEADPTEVSCPGPNFCGNVYDVADPQPDGDGTGPRTLVVGPAGIAASAPKGIDTDHPEHITCPAPGRCIVLGQTRASLGTN